MTVMKLEENGMEVQTTLGELKKGDHFRYVDSPAPNYNRVFEAIDDGYPTANGGGVVCRYVEEKIMDRTIKQQCPLCGGTGLYSGFMEHSAEARVCRDCKGKGWILHTYSIFERRKLKNGIKTVFVWDKDRNSYVTLSYAKFMEMFPSE